MLMAATTAHGREVLELLEPHCTDIREHPGDGRGRDVRRGVGRWVAPETRAPGVGRARPSELSPCALTGPRRRPADARWARVPMPPPECAILRP